MLKIIKRYFVSGVLVVVPIILTIVVIKFIFETGDGLLQPYLQKLLGYSIPGLGIVVTLLLIILAGLLTRNFIGAEIHRLVEKMLTRLPIIRTIYSAAKQLLEAIALPSMSSFKEVVMIEYPRKDAYVICFISQKFKLEKDGQLRDFMAIFVPSTPTPISGMVIIVPAEDVIYLDMTIEEAIKYLVSGGVVSPAVLRQKKRQPAAELER
ncbi:MAG: DUF502 domain-containing protein [candidate division Zixibacteria bacterium]|nr:DUF502 domain-containing protein [candidate division Zixibacteria bacterium]